MAERNEDDVTTAEYDSVSEEIISREERRRHSDIRDISPSDDPLDDGSLLPEDQTLITPEDRVRELRAASMAGTDQLAEGKRRDMPSMVVDAAALATNEEPESPKITRASVETMQIELDRAGNLKGVAPIGTRRAPRWRGPAALGAAVCLLAGVVGWRVARSIFVADDEQTAREYAQREDGAHGFYFNVMRSKLTNAWMDSRLGTVSTARNLKTISKLLELAGD